MTGKSPRHPAELLGGVLEQRLDRIGPAAIERAEIPPRRTGLVQPDIFSPEDVDRVFGTDGALALAQLGQPEIGVRMVGRPWIKIEIELEGDMQGLKLGIAPVDRGNEDLPDPLCAISERRGGVLRLRAVGRFRARARPLAPIHEGIA